MSLFPEGLINDLLRLPGARYSFARQVADPDGQAVRELLETIAGRVGPAVNARWTELFSSLDNRRFFQGFSEAATASLLMESGWTVPDLAWPGPGLELVSPDGQRFHGLILGFIRQLRPLADKASIDRLKLALSRVAARSRVGLVIQRWLPHDFDPEPVRHAVELWLREVERGSWTGRYAAYEDDYVSLEFALTGETAARGENVLAFSLGPFQAHRVLEAVGSRVVQELDRLRMTGRADEPVIVSCVSDQPWRLPRGYLRELLYGKPDWQTTNGGAGSLESAFEDSDAPSLYRDVLYRNTALTLFVERPEDAPAQLRGRAFQNPWSSASVGPDQLVCPTLAQSRTEDERAVMRWFNQG